MTMTGDPTHGATDPEIRYYPKNLDNASDPQKQARYHGLVDMCRQHVDVSLLHFVAHLANGAPTFSVDVLGHDELSGHFRGTHHPDDLRDALLRLGRRFNYDMGNIDKDLRELRTGRLMRTVLDVGTAGVYWYWIHGIEFLVGMTLSGQRVDRADRSIAEIAESILESLGRQPRDYGGFQRGIAREFTRAGRDDVEPSVRESLVSQGFHNEAVDHCKDAVRPEDLHYVAIFAEGSWQFSVDVLEEERTIAFGGLVADRRRELYQHVGERLQFVVSQLDRTLIPVTRHHPGKLVRTVLDVESGALYYHPLGPGRYAVGVTLFQKMVATADDRMRTLVENLRATAEANGVANP
jgi:hypothetical protein